MGDACVANSKTGENDFFPSRGSIRGGPGEWGLFYGEKFI